MSVSLYEHFLETIEHVPSELQRNFTLMSQLDTRTKELIERINQNVQTYRNTSKKSERSSIYKETMEMFDKAKAFADDKIDLAFQTYELVDKHIRRLECMGPAPTSVDTNGTGVASSESCAGIAAEPLGMNMPVDPNEPTYCTCNNVSHGEMIACDNKECPIEWFHFSCVNLKSKPKGKWYCPECFNTNRKGSKHRPSAKRQRVS